MTDAEIREAMERASTAEPGYLSASVIRLGREALEARRLLRRNLRLLGRIGVGGDAADHACQEIREHLDGEDGGE